MYIDVITGFLGSGKTTLILHLMAALSGQEKLAVIVNEFGDIGIDGAVLANRGGAEVVELTSGCICCTLSRDLVGQVETLARNYAPDRLLIEPSGVATVSSMLKALRSLRLERYVEAIRIICLLDASDFCRLFAENRLYVESQLGKASMVIINKTDLVTPQKIREIRDIVAAINDHAKVISTSFGHLPLADYLAGEEQTALWTGEPDNQPDSLAPLSFAHELEKVALKCAFPLDFQALDSFLAALQQGFFGRLVRAKGIVRLQDGRRLLFNLAAGQLRTEFLGQVGMVGKIFLVGRELKRELLLDYLGRCRSEVQSCE